MNSIQIQLILLIKTNNIILNKLIIIIAVAVVVIAGIGIAAYNPPKDNGGHTGSVGGIQTYDVTWQTHTKTVSVDDEMYAGKNSPFSTEITVDHENVIKVTVEISWKDDSTYRGLLSKGEDTLTAEVGFATEAWTSVYNGTYEFIKELNNLPYDTTIDADDEQAAYDKLKEEYGTDDSLTFTIDVSVVTGEKIFRPLKYFKDKGNDFDLTITYEYYDASLTEGSMSNTGQDNNDSYTSEDLPAYLGMMIQSGLTRW